MYATIILSQAPDGVRQTAVIPSMAGTRVFNRVGFGRGLAATWQEEWPAYAQSELVYGRPISLAMTGAHVRDANIQGRTPNNILQALGKLIANIAYVPTSVPLAEAYGEVLHLTEHNMSELGKFVPTRVSVVAQPPVTRMAPAPQPEPVAVAPVTPVAPPVINDAPQMFNELATAKSLNVLTVPNVQEYYERSFEDIKESVIYQRSQDNQWNILLMGDAGTGKTSSARNFAARNNLPFVVIECTQQIDNSVTQGRFVPDEDGKSIKWVYSQLATAIQQPSVVLLNELTRMTPKSASLFLRLLAERELFIEPFNEVIKVHPQCLIVADANIGTNYSGTMRSDGALLDRFHVKLPFTYDSKLEANFLPYPALLEFATAIRSAVELGEEDFSVPMSTRLLQNFVSHVTAFNWKFAVERLLSNFPVESGERQAIKMRIEADAPRIAGEFQTVAN